MKHFLLLLLGLVSFLTAIARPSDVTSFSIRVVQPERENLNAAACQVLQSKMMQLLTKSGIVNDLPSNRFVLTARANLLNKDIIAGLPSRVSIQLELVFLIGDVQEGMVFETYAIPLVGVGLNDDSAIQQAIKSVKVDDPELHRFIDRAKQKIVNFYLDNESRILREADALVAVGRYEEAIYGLALVPSACGKCYDHCQDRMLDIYQMRIDQEGISLLSQAKAAWAKNPDASGAESAYNLITSINPRASCFEEVQPFLDQITDKLVADDLHNWEFKMRRYEDEIQREQRDFEERVAMEQKIFEEKKAQDARNAALRRQAVEAARQVGVAFARNMPDVVYKNTVVLW